MKQRVQTAVSCAGSLGHPLGGMPACQREQSGTIRIRMIRSRIAKVHGTSVTFPELACKVNGDEYRFVLPVSRAT